MIRIIARAGLGTLFTFLMTVLGAGMVFFKKEKGSVGSQKTLLGFVAGVMTRRQACGACCCRELSVFAGGSTPETEG